MEKPPETQIELECGQNSQQLSEEEPPKVSPKTWLVVGILSMGYGLSFIPVPAMSAVGPQIAAEFGDASKNLWFVSSWIVSITISFAIM